uniref:Uncharacterized protein n=1 Tax=Medicago truncatula TaxID=3880 RepID=I3S8F4_MEDTR|nr:unknown [Medicago truncatula]
MGLREFQHLVYQFPGTRLMRFVLGCCRVVEIWMRKSVLSLLERLRFGGERVRGIRGL